MHMILEGETPVFHAVCESMKHYRDVDGIKRVALERAANGHVQWDVECTFVLGGVELDFSQYLTQLLLQYDRIVQDAAYELLKQKHGELLDKLDAIKRSIQAAFPDHYDDD